MGRACGGVFVSARRIGANAQNLQAQYEREHSLGRAYHKRYAISATIFGRPTRRGHSTWRREWKALLAKSRLKNLANSTTIVVLPEWLATIVRVEL